MSKRGNHFAHLVIERDKVCQICGASENLQAHHIIPISEDGPDVPENGIALCPACHADQHPERLRGVILEDTGRKLVGVSRKDPEALSDKKLITIRTSLATSEKIGALKEKYRTATEVIAVAIDRLYREEVTGSKIKAGDVLIYPMAGSKGKTLRQGTVAAATPNTVLFEDGNWRYTHEVSKENQDTD